MRTKTLLLTAAVLAAGLGASLAQSVFSVNAVGYVNLTIKPGYNLISNPLNGTNNVISTVIPAANLPDDTECLTWNSGVQDFNQSVLVAGGVWVDQLGAPATTVLNPGRGFFIHSLVLTNFPVTFVGDVPQGNLTNNISANYDFVASIVPQSAGLSTIGFPGVVDMTYATFNTTTHDYDQALVYIGVQPGYPSGWADQVGTPVDPTPAVAQGFLIQNPAGSPPQKWGRTFSVN